MMMLTNLSHLTLLEFDNLILDLGLWIHGTVLLLFSSCGGISNQTWHYSGGPRQSPWDLLHIVYQAAIPIWSELAGPSPFLILILVVLGLDLCIPLYDLLSKLQYQLIVFSQFLPWTPIFLPIWMKIFPFARPLCIILLHMYTSDHSSCLHSVCISEQSTGLIPWLVFVHFFGVCSWKWLLS